jgi:hypothetical protein
MPAETSGAHAARFTATALTAAALGFALLTPPGPARISPVIALVAWRIP